MVLDAETSLTEALYRHMVQAANQSCGRCTPCRVGTQRMRDLLKQIADGTASEGVFVELDSLASQVTETALCGLGQSCARALLGALRHFRAELSRPA